MSAPSAAAAWWLALAGWSACVALWHTTAIALAFGAWRAWHGRASARTEYAMAATALGLSLALTLVTPMALRFPVSTGAWPSVATAVAIDSPSLVRRPAGVTVPASEVGSAAASSAARAVPWIGALWAAGVAVALVRLAGGWATALWIRRRATRVDAPHLVAALADVSTGWGLPPAALLASPHVDAPVVVGARTPVVLLPVDLETHLEAAAVRPLLAHELAHVRRHDYASNLAQSIADAVLWFCPGARILSRAVREAREYCCDDVVAARCGPGAYAAALTALARLGVAARPRLAVNAAGPRLIVRIRRLLQEDTMVPFARVRVVALAVLGSLVVAAGTVVVPLSAAGVAGATRGGSGAAEGPVPIGWVTTRAGAAVVLRQMISTDAGACGTATVENRADVAVAALRFVAVGHVARMHPSDALDGVVSSPFVDAPIEPGGTVTVPVGLVAPDELRRRFDGQRVQAMCAIQAVRFANGHEWNATPAELFARQHSEVARSFLNRDTSGNPAFCRDEQGLETSQGGIIGIALEPGRLARCEGGVWREYHDPARTPGAPFVWMEFRIPSGHLPRLGVQPGQLAQLSFVGGRQLGVRPIVDPMDESRVRLDVIDMAVTPNATIVQLPVRVGDDPAEIPGTSLAVRVRSTRTP